MSAQHIHALNDYPAGADCLLAIGSFDGVHRGHQAVISRMVAQAGTAGLRAVALTFHPHPAVLLGKRPQNSCLTLPYARAQQLLQFGVDVVITQPFDREISLRSADAFIALLQEQLHFRQLWCGQDFALGYRREGDTTWLAQHAPQYGYQLQVTEPFYWENAVLSSTRIRQWLHAGKVEIAGQALGRRFAVCGVVVRGQQLGRQLGFPTANVQLSPEQLLPANGVYACRVVLANAMSYLAAVNIGLRPTLNRELGLSVEAHLLDFSGDLYGQELCIQFEAFLRPEQKFNGLPALIAQIEQDVARVRLLCEN